MNLRLVAISATAALLAGASPALAQGSQVASAAGPIVAGTAATAEFDRFKPRPSGSATQIDYEFFNEALKFMVLGMGQSTREGMTKPAPGIGSRLTYGHTARTRLEGNRIVFSYLDQDAITPLTEYRAELERLGSELDIATLPRNEQLAYWINLHNVSVIEQVALNYPTRSPSLLKLGPDNTPLDRTRFINVGGVAMSPHDIRTKIVFPNWQDPNVIYGFFRGEIGGPSIQRRAFTGQEVGTMLASSAKEFVNSLRGVEAYGDNLLVSAIYEEAAPFYFANMDADLRAHILTHADKDVRELVATKPGIKFNQYEDAIADLAAGKREPTYSYIETDGLAQRTRVTASVARLLGERAEKLEKLRREGLLQGRVIVLPMGTAEEPAPEPAEEVE